MTTHLGVGITLSTAFEHPYSMARRLATFDHLSGGRIAWDIVGSYSPSEFAAYGQDMPDRSTRYERIEEYAELCCRLWDSWQPDAIVADRETGIYAHPEKIAEVRFDGKYFRCRARHFVAPSPQGRPVLWQAGASEQGRQFAARTAEAIFAIQPTVPSMRAYSDDIRRRVVAAGRDPESVKLFYGAQVMRALFRPEASLAMLSGQLGVDFSEFDPSAPLEDIPVPGIQGVKDALVASGAGAAVTVAEAADIYAFRFSMPQVVGTPSEVADQQENYLDEGGADGFMLLATYTPGCFEEFVDLVVPELQRRGRYRTTYPGRTLRENIRAVASDAFAARAIVLTAAQALQEASDSATDGVFDPEAAHRAQIAAAQAKVAVDRFSYATAARLLDVGGASATQVHYGHDRHWRNIRTISTHNPTFLKATAVGSLLVNGTPPPQNGFF